MNKEKSMTFKNIINRLNADKHLTRLIIIFLLLFVALTLVNPDRFLSVDNFQSMMVQFPEYGMMAFGIMLTMIIGGIDLSVVGVANLTSIVVASILLGMAPKGTPEGQTSIVIVFAIIVAIGVGASCGFINGFLISKVGIPPILATLGTQQFFTGLAIIITKGAALSRLPIMYSNLISTTVFDLIPLSFIIFIVAMILLSLILNKTRYGSEIYMMGFEPEGSKIQRIEKRSADNQNTYLCEYIGSCWRTDHAGELQLGESGLRLGLYAAVHPHRCAGRGQSGRRIW